MDRAYLISTAINYKMEVIGMKEMSTAVDEYSAALIAQSECSKLRVLLLQMLVKEEQLACDEEKGSHEWYAHTLNRERVAHVLSLMDIHYPVA